MSLIIIDIPTADLRASEYNPRHMTEEDVKDLASSLDEFGLVDPLVVNRHPDRLNVVVGGHQRLRLLVERGEKSVPCSVGSWTLEQEQRLNLRLNKNVGRWAWDLLANLDLTMLRSVGFTPSELNLGLGLNLSGDNPAELWTGMPEFSQPEAGAFRSVIIHVKDEDAFLRLVEVLGVKVTDKTKYIWWPHIEIDSVADIAYVAEQKEDADGGA